jgi:hypothetical protein
MASVLAICLLPQEIGLYFLAAGLEVRLAERLEGRGASSMGTKLGGMAEPRVNACKTPYHVCIPSISYALKMVLNADILC